MSAWSVGADRIKAVTLSSNGGANEFIGRIVRWIPGDIVVLFAGAINWISAEPAAPNMRLLVLFAVATPIVVLLGAFSKRDLARFDFVKAILATIAFGVWSLSVPRSGWQQWEVLKENPGWVTASSALGGVIFALLASGVERKYGAGEYRN